MNVIADLFPALAEHRIPTEGAVFVRTGRSGPPLLHGQPQPHVCRHKIAPEPARLHAVCEYYRARGSIRRELDEADLAARIKSAAFVEWGSECLDRDGAKPIEARQAWCTKVSGAAVRAGHFLAKENALAVLIQADAGSD